MVASSLYAFAALGFTAVTATARASPVSIYARNNDGASPTAVIANGTVEGIRLSGFDQVAFLGVPYAQPPVGNLRLRRAGPLTSGFEGGTYLAGAYSPFCPGIGADNFAYNMSEDCLTLNVLRPADVTKDAKLPVGVWVHGGGFQMGGSGDTRYNGSYVVQRSAEMEKPIIFVSINYRVSSLGFLASDELRAEGNVNLGLYDIRLALGWLQDNIGAFGGDPRKVTLWGQSAGAAAISYEMLAYGLTSTPLFRGAILESGSPTGRPLAAPEVSQSRFDEVVASAGCNATAEVLACLRGLSLEAFNASARAYTWNPVVDGGIIPEYPSDALWANPNTDEGTAYGTKNITTDAQLAASLQAYYPRLTNSSAAELIERYPNDPSLGAPYETGDGLLASGLQDKRSNVVTGDLRYIAGKRLFAEKYAAADLPVFVYRYNQPAENATIEQGTAHFAEVAYVFSNPDNIGSRPGDAALATLMTSQWVSFIHDGTPNNNGVDGAPEWPDYRDQPRNFVYTRKEWTTEADNFRQDGIKYIQGLGWELSA